MKKIVLAALVCSMMLVGQLSAQGLSSAESAIGENGFSLGYVLGYAGEFFLGDLSDFVPQTHGFWTGGTAGCSLINAELDETSVDALRLMAGVQLDLKIMRGASQEMALFGLLPMRVKMDSGLRLRVFMARNFYKDPCEGNSLNV